MENKQTIINELENLQSTNGFYYKGFWITKSPIGGFTVVSVVYHCTEHFSNARRVVNFLLTKTLDKVIKV